ncbi:hypothetical protein ACSBLW_09205 [Thioclava sp. FR2]|uniref:hypothetical protein n=1 Tax=Thioclava sp. FR2 TaxID=3445780 RepID=UPI003EB7F9C9
MTSELAYINVVQPYLNPGEKVLWLAPERQPRAATPAALAIGLMIVAAVIWYFWLSDPPFLDRCSFGGSRTCGFLYYAAPPAVAIMWISQFVQMMQHVLMSKGRAFRLNVLTDSRFVRLATWPWVSVRGTDLKGNSAIKKYPSRLFFSRRDFYFLHPEELDKVLALISKAQKGDAI